MLKINVKRKDEVIYIKGHEIDNIEKYIENFKRLDINRQYSIIVRLSYISYRDDMQYYTEWRTLGEQIPFNLDTILDLDLKVKNIMSVIMDRLFEKLELYQVEYNDVLGIQLLVFNIDKIDKKVKLSLKNLGEHKDLINISKTKDVLRILPLDNISNVYPKLEKIIDNDTIKVKLLDGSIFNIKEKLSKHNKDISFLTEETNYYQILVNKKDYIITSFIKGDKNYINVYNMLGYKISSVIDINNFDNIIRKVGNINLYLYKNKIVNKEIDQNFKVIKPKKLGVLKSKMIYSDYRIGTLDLETYLNKDNISKTYAIGYYTKDNCKTFYINNKLNSAQLIMDCLDDMLVEKYHNYTFYVHNFSRFDVYFMLKVIMDNQQKQPEIYSYDLIMKDGNIICLNIQKKIKTEKTIKKYSIKLVDSYNILKASLKKLCKTYNPKTYKGIFPYKFVNENTIFYNGVKPEISYYIIPDDDDNDYHDENISKSGNKIISDSDYKNIKEFNWSTKNETLKYLQDDLISLYEVMDIFKKHVWLNYDVHITNSYTISGISMEVYLNKYYNNNIPLINKKSVHNDVRESYYGGITEVYIPYGENLYYYDVNSLYPYAALNPMPGINCTYIENINKDLKDCTDLFGFYYCEIITCNNYFGILPVRLSNNSIIMPEGYIKGWYFSEELKFAEKNGYKINILYGYKFDKSYNVFKDYVEHFYNIKQHTNDKVKRATAKSFLNNLLGRFGLSINKPITKILNLDEFKKIQKTRKIINMNFIGDKILVTYESDLSPKICYQHNLDFKQEYFDLLKENNKKENTINVSVPISSAVTSYSRIFMNDIKYKILNNNGKIYYTDTDSIVTNIPLDNTLIGDDIGKFKLEYKIKKGYFLSNKTYCLILHNDKTIIKVKGVNSPISVKDFINLYNGVDLETTRFESYKNIAEGYVNIKIPRTITLLANSYEKRLKVYDNNKKWVNTKPLNISMFKRNYSTKRLINSKVKSLSFIMIKKVIFYSTTISILLISLNIYILLTLLGIDNELHIKDFNINNIININNIDKNNLKFKLNVWETIHKDYNKLNHLDKSNNLKLAKRSSIAINLLENNINNLIKENNNLINEINYFKDIENKNKLFYNKLSLDLKQGIDEFKYIKNKMDKSLNDFKDNNNLFYDE